MKRVFLFRAFFCLILIFLFGVAAPRVFSIGPGGETPDDAVGRAMRDELARSTAQLQLENLEKPYFMAYRVVERWSQATSASFGSTLNENENHSRAITIEVRVGSAALDNTNFQSGFNGSFGTVSVQLPLDDNVTELRRQIWLATDRAYKSAGEALAKKKAVLQNKTRTDETPDFSAQDPAHTSDIRAGGAIDLDQARALARALSAVFRETPAVATSFANVGGTRERTRYVNSEGATFDREAGLVSLIVAAGTQAPDGFPLDDHLMINRRRWEELPAKDELLAAARELGSRLTSLRDAPLIEQYNGPVLFEGQAAAEIFAQVFAPNLSARKRPVVEGSAGGGAENPFLDKIGARVLADFLSLTDDATLGQLGADELLGGARVDDEGVPTRAVNLVEKGRLKTLLVGRSPVRGVAQSTGSVQGSGPGPTNLIMTAAEGRDAAALKAELLSLAQQRGRDYGVIIRRVGNPQLHVVNMLGGGPTMISAGSREGVRVDQATLAYKVFPDGHEELVRNVEIAGMTAATFKEILAAGAEPRVITLPFRNTSIGNALIVSIALPDLLFEEITLKTPSGEIPRPPVAEHPFFAK
jgi:hypothetical protein